MSNNMPCGMAFQQHTPSLFYRMLNLGKKLGNFEGNKNRSEKFCLN